MARSSLRVEQRNRRQFDDIHEFTRIFNNCSVTERTTLTPDQQHAVLDILDESSEPDVGVAIIGVSLYLFVCYGASYRLHAVQARVLSEKAENYRWWYEFRDPKSASSHDDCEIAKLSGFSSSEIRGLIEASIENGRNCLIRLDHGTLTFVSTPLYAPDKLTAFGPPRIQEPNPKATDQSKQPLGELKQTKPFF